MGRQCMLRTAPKVANVCLDLAERAQSQNGTRYHRSRGPQHALLEVWVRDGPAPSRWSLYCRISRQHYGGAGVAQRGQRSVSLVGHHGRTVVGVGEDEAPKRERCV